MSALSLAACNGHNDVCLALITAGARVGMPSAGPSISNGGGATDDGGPSGGGISALHASAQGGFTETFKLLKAEGVHQVSRAGLAGLRLEEAPDFLGRSPLHLAVAAGHLSLVCTNSAI
jgi:hypothetical protein